MPPTPDALHPAIVHLPVALTVLIPILATVAILLIERSFRPDPGWAVVIPLARLRVGSAWHPFETVGGEEAKRVARAVAERHTERHEEAARSSSAPGGPTGTPIAIPSTQEDPALSPWRSP